MIPDFSVIGLLPPYIGEDPTSSAYMLPYKTSLQEISNRFGQSDRRKMIFEGLMNYNSRLKDLGFGSGYQLICGSFTEDCEKNRGKDQEDVDVVTLASLPDYCLSENDIDILYANNADVFDHDTCKEVHYVDAYIVNSSVPQSLIMFNYLFWGNLFTHTRDKAWKGILCVKFNGKD